MFITARIDYTPFIMTKYREYIQRMIESKQEILVKYAKKHLGKPYQFGAKPYQAPKKFDCSSFVQLAMLGSMLVMGRWLTQNINKVKTEKMTVLL